MRIYHVQWTDNQSTVVLIHFDMDAIRRVVVTGQKARLPGIDSQTSVTELDRVIRNLAEVARAKITVK